LGNSVTESKLLVVGGYGRAGSEVVRVLAPQYPGRVLVAGRRQDEADKLCREIGHSTSSRRIDVNDAASFGSALLDVGTIVCCIDQPRRLLLNAAVARGLAYTDIAPRLTSFEGVERLSHEARASGARVIVGAGLSPGITSVLARAGADRVGAVDRVESSVLLSVGDVFGPAAVAFVLDEVRRAFPVRVEGSLRRAYPFRGSRKVAFPAPCGRRRAYLFPFSDAAGYPKTLGARTARAWLALDPPWLGRSVRVMLALGARQLLGRPGFAGRNQRLIERVKRKHAGRDRYAVLVEVEGSGSRMALGVTGRNQSHATGVGAAEIARALCDGEVDRAGLWYAEQVIDPIRFLARLRMHDLDVVSRLEAI
jgi:saccharopine dehydrogenase-like NADP-dependent oxidoreductase